ncbi:MAG: tetratricopeptide repeat protein [Proteobacteria bacterium]|nr:tetratricopeptide repeat protein [Pseudomonadota bacterium]
MNLLQALKQAEQQETPGEGAGTPAYPTLDFPLQPDLPAPISADSIKPAKPLPEPPPVRTSPDMTAPGSTPPLPINPGSTGQTGNPIRLTPRIKPKHRLSLWLGVGGGVLLAGMGIWFWWQMQTLTPPAAPLPIVRAENPAPFPVASTEADGKEEGIPPAASSPPPLQPPSLRAAPMPSRKPHAQPAADVRTAYIEPQAIPTNLPQIERNRVETGIPAALEAAWQDWQRGDLASAEENYRRMLEKDPRHRDALLGLAAIAARRGQTAQATQAYQHLLALNPQDEAARTGLLLIRPEAMSESAEARLLQHAEQKHSPQILAQYYAARHRWHEAQEQYFRAFVHTPDNADLAYNLAVSLDHLGQAKLAVEHYRKALALGHGSFEHAVVAQRLAELVGASR